MKNSIKEELGKIIDTSPSVLRNPLDLLKRCLTRIDELEEENRKLREVLEHKEDIREE